MRLRYLEANKFLVDCDVDKRCDTCATLFYFSSPCSDCFDKHLYSRYGTCTTLTKVVENENLNSEYWVDGIMCTTVTKVVEYALNTKSDSENNDQECKCTTIGPIPISTLLLSNFRDWFFKVFAKMMGTLLIQFNWFSLLPFLTVRFIQESFLNLLACPQSWKVIF